MEMSYDNVRIGLLGFSFSLTKKDNQIKLNEGETILLRYWSWKKMGYLRKAYSMKKGMVTMTRLE